MATPVRTLSSAGVATGDPTRESHYDNLRADMEIALTERDYGATGSRPSVPAVGQQYLDTTLDVLYMCMDGTNWDGIASTAVTIDNTGITLESGAVAYMQAGAGMTIPVGANKWVTS